MGELPSWGPTQLISRDLLLMFDNLTPVGGDGTSVRYIRACRKVKTLHNFYIIMNMKLDMR